MNEIHPAVNPTPSHSSPILILILIAIEIAIEIAKTRGLLSKIAVKTLRQPLYHTL